MLQVCEAVAYFDNDDDESLEVLGQFCLNDGTS